MVKQNNTEYSSIHKEYQIGIGNGQVEFKNKMDGA
jgi:hypothetical protein